MSRLSTHPRALALPLAIGLAVAAAPALAANPPARPAADAGKNTTALPAVKVTGSYPTIELDTAGTASLIGRQQMDRQLVTTIRDLVRYEPGVSAIGSAGRFGLDSFNIRGLSGNRTYMEIDGVPMASSFGADIAGNSFRAGRDYIDLDEIKRVEIIRGPVSALYPSDALGGSVILTTKDPADYLKPGKRTHVSIKEQYSGIDRSFDTTATFAAGNPRNGFLLVANHRDGHATSNQGEVGGIGATRTRPDPMHYHLNSLLGKYVHTAGSGRVDRFTADASRTRTDTNGLSERVPDSFEGFVPDYYRAQDADTRFRASLGQWYPHLDSALADALNWHAYWQLSRTRTKTQTDTPTVARFFDTLPLQERVLGGKLVAVKHLGEDATAQAISYGLALSRTNDQSWAHGHGVDKLTGASGSSAAFLPGDYPLHLIPESNTTRSALFAQDRIHLIGGRLVITPGVRIEHYAYKPGNDTLYLKYNPGYVQKDYRENHVSPKLGVIWHFTDTLSAYADYAGGFRPPLYSDLSGSWNEQPVPGFNIAFLPSPDLQAETSRNAEIGLRGQGNAGWFNLAVYYNRYRDFIWSGYQLPDAQVPSWAYQLSPGAFFNLFFQSVNARRAWIKGAEASGRLRLGAFGDVLDGWSLHAAASIASGALIEPGDDFYSPLNTVDPARLVVGIDYDGVHWGAQLVGTAVRRHARLGNPDTFRPAGYATLDFFVHWRAAEHFALYLGATNLTDRTYWDWGNLNGGMLGNLVSGNGVNDAGTGGLPADRLSMPGRAFSAAVKLTF